MFYYWSGVAVGCGNEDELGSSSSIMGRLSRAAFCSSELVFGRDGWNVGNNRSDPVDLAQGFPPW